MNSRLFKIMLIIIALLLALNLLGIRPAFRPTTPAIAFGGGGQIACSSDGQYVYWLVNGMTVLMSDDYGKSFRQQTRVPTIYVN